MFNRMDKSKVQQNESKTGKKFEKPEVMLSALASQVML